MKFSIGIPTCMEGLMYPVPFMKLEQILRTAQRAEELGYHSVWGNDHLTTQSYVRDEYDQQPRYWEPLMILAAIAQATTTLRLGTGVLVPAMRQDIVVLAKQIATLDHLSKGRFMLGVGIGAYREEFEALRPGAKVNRAAMLEEALTCLRQLFTGETVSWEGNNYNYKNVTAYPKPLQDPLPIYVGGNNPNSLARTAKFGQAWLGAGMPVWQMKDAIQHLKVELEANGRTLDDIEIAPQFCVCIDSTYEKAVARYQRSQMYRHLVSLSGTSLKDQVGQGVPFEEIDLIGTAESISERIRQYRDIGVSHVCGSLQVVDSAAEYTDQMERFAAEVLPNLA